MTSTFGTRVDVHADFDGGGLGIVGAFAALGYRPWRMDAADYLEVIDRAAGPRPTLAVPPTPWDPALVAVYRENLRPVYEEQILDKVLA